MRNTHFGDGGFGFGTKIKGDISLDSDRKISRKRGAKVAKPDEQAVNREYHYNNKNGPHGLVIGGGVVIASQIAHGQLNRSITFN